MIGKRTVNTGENSVPYIKKVPEIVATDRLYWYSMHAIQMSL